MTTPKFDLTIRTSQDHPLHALHLRFVKFAARMEATTRPPTLTDAEAAAVDRTVSCIRRAVDAQLKIRRPAGFELSTAEAVARSAAKQLIRFAGETPLAPSELDAFAIDLGRQLAGETPEEWTGRQEALERDQEVERIAARKAAQESAALLDWEKRREEAMGTIEGRTLQLYKDLTKTAMFPRTQAQQEHADELRALYGAAVSAFITRGGYTTPAEAALAVIAEGTKKLAEGSAYTDDTDEAMKATSWRIAAGFAEWITEGVLGPAPSGVRAWSGPAQAA